MIEFGKGVMTALIHQPMVTRINRRASRRRLMAPIWELLILSACIITACGLVASIAVASADIGRTELPNYRTDSDILVRLLNGERIRVDNSVMTCKIGRKA